MCRTAAISRSRQAFYLTDVKSFSGCRCTILQEDAARNLERRSVECYERTQRRSQPQDRFGQNGQTQQQIFAFSHRPGRVLAY